MAFGGACPTVERDVDYSQADLEAKITALETTLAKGELTVEFADRRVTYRSTNEITAALEYFKGLLVTVTGTGRRRQFLATAGKGFC